MTIPQLMEKMISFSDGNIHDIDHFIRVWAFASNIGKMEKLDEETQFILEAAALTHDIACPLCREKYGNTHAKHQEEEGAALVRDFLADTGLSDSEVERVAYLVGHHHTLENVEGTDYRILIEADFIANAEENGCSPECVQKFMDKNFGTESGRRLLKALFCV